ncbi:MAG: methyltransferase [Acidobacteriia bacterium]|nr:methyltransferase [Terriglobia bacterium]
MSQSAPPPNPSAQILQLATGYIASTAIYVAARLGIADLLKDGPRPASWLATATHSHPDRLYRVLRALAGFGVFTESTPGTFALTPAAETLRSDVPGSVRDMAVWMADPFHFRIYAEMMHTVQTGETTFDHIYGKSAFEYFPEDPAESEVFNAAMTSLSTVMIPAVLEAYDFSGIGTLMDVAGGHGAFLRAILNKYPSMRGVLIDMDHVIEGARQLPENQALAHRCDFQSADFFAAVPTGADAIIMKHIIHDWDDDKAVRILQNCLKALSRKQGAKVLVVDMVVPPGDEPHFSKILDLEMMALPSGRERSQKEFEKLFTGAGLRLNRIVPTKSPVSVVEGVVV